MYRFYLPSIFVDKGAHLASLVPGEIQFLELETARLHRAVSMTCRLACALLFCPGLVILQEHRTDCLESSPGLCCEWEGSCGLVLQRLARYEDKSGLAALHRRCNGAV